MYISILLTGVVLGTSMLEPKNIVENYSVNPEKEEEMVSAEVTENSRWQPGRRRTVCLC